MSRNHSIGEACHKPGSPERAAARGRVRVAWSLLILAPLMCLVSLSGCAGVPGSDLQMAPAQARNAFGNLGWSEVTDYVASKGIERVYGHWQMPNALGVGVAVTNDEQMAAAMALPCEKLGVYAEYERQDMSRYRPRHPELLREFEFISEYATNCPSLRGCTLDEAYVAGQFLMDIGGFNGASARSVQLLVAGAVSLDPLRRTGVTDLSIYDARVLDMARFSDLSGLAGMGLTRLNVYATDVESLAPLDGMDLVHLSLGSTRVSDLTPLTKMILVSFDANDTPIRDLSPLRNSRLEALSISRTKVEDLSPVADMPLESLYAEHTPIHDLSPLRNTKLKWLSIVGTGVQDLSPLAGLPLRSIDVDIANIRKGLEVLAENPELTSINDKPPSAILPASAKSGSGPRMSDPEPVGNP